MVDGRITWIVDGYTTLAELPVRAAACRWARPPPTRCSRCSARQLDRDVSYIRNSVKATVDAYDGTVTLYAFDETDPVLQTWMKTFPDTVQPASEISPSLRSHFRYPEDLFKVQRELLTRYHVDNPLRVLRQRVVLGRAVRPDGAGRRGRQARRSRRTTCSPGNPAPRARPRRRSS